MTEKEITFDDIYSAVTRPRHYGQKYQAADSEDKLLLLLAEACCLSAFSLVQILKLPKRGRLILRLIKLFSPQRYQKHYFLYNFSFSHCLIYISRKLKVVLKHELSEEESEHISLTAYTWGATYLMVFSNYSVADTKQLRIEIKQRVSDYYLYETIEEKILLEKIIDGLDRKVQPEQIAIFFKETIVKNPLYIVEPFRFIERLKEIKS